MGLRDITLPTTTLTLGNGSYEVRGLSFDDIADLATRHAPAAAMLYQEFIQTEGSALSPEKLGMLLPRLKEMAPNLIAEVIAWASDDRDPSAVRIAARMTLEKQIDAIKAIVGHTFESEESLGNIVAAVIQGMNSSRVVITKLTDRK